MRIRVLRFEELTPGQLARWSAFQQQNTALASPFFCAEYIWAASSCCPGVRIGVMEEGGDTTGLFPFERRFGVLARPAAYAISDHQGVIAPADARWDVEELMSACGIRIFEYNHLSAAHAAFAAHHRRQDVSPVINLAAGYEAYKQERRAAGTEQIKKLGTLARKLEREIGPLRLEAHVTDPGVLRTLVDWKIRHDLQRGYQPALRLPWVRSMVERIHGIAGPGFSGMLSALYAGDKLTALHMGMRSATVWHYWMPAYDEQYAKYSPGLILLMRMAEAAPGLGVTCIDMGRGKMDYKDRFANGSVPLAEGRVCLSRQVEFMFQGARKVRRWLRGARSGSQIRLEDQG